MGGFTRLVASEGGKPDGLEAEMPSFFVRQYTTAEIARYGRFGVLNRPFSVVQFADRGGFEALQEQFVYIAETDRTCSCARCNIVISLFSLNYIIRRPTTCSCARCRTWRHQTRPPPCPSATRTADPDPRP